MGVQTIASVRDETLPVDFSRTAERGAKTFLKRKFIKKYFLRAPTTENFGVLT